MRKIRTGIIGCGKVGHLHARAMMGVERAEFVAVCHRAGGMEKARGFAAQYPGVKAYDDINEMRERSGVEMVCVCTQHPEHVGPTVRALKAGMHVLVEKPLASSLADCDLMIGAARESGVKLGVISQRRFYEPCLRVKRAIEAGKIGRAVVGSVTMFGWRDEKYYASDPWRGKWATEGGGVLVNQAPHQLDLLLWYMGEVAEVKGFWANVNHPYIEVEDTAVASVRFKSGGVAQILVSNSQNPALYGKVMICGSNGASVGVQTDGGQMFIAGVSGIAEPPFNDVWTVPGEEKMGEEWKAEDTEFFATHDGTTYFHGLQIGEFLKAVTEGREPAVTGEDGRRVVELFSKIYEQGGKYAT